MPGLQPSNINHELCHYTDDVTRMAGLQPSNIVGSATILECEFMFKNERCTPIDASSADASLMTSAR
jgi:hypothetical protein